jgi:hypothetical protein
MKRRGEERERKRGAKKPLSEMAQYEDPSVLNSGNRVFRSSLSVVAQLEAR